MKAQYNTRISQQGHLVVISRTVHVPTIFKQSPKRRQINGLSKSAASRMAKYLRCSRANYGNMVTLTYPHGYPEDGRIFKDHLRRFLQEMQRHSRLSSDDARGTDQRYSTFWFLEFQKRGAPHFHLFTTDRFEKSWIARTWFRIVGSDDDRHLRAGTRIEKMRSGRRGVCSYALKYASKSDQKEVPEWVENVGRFWGVSGDRHAVAADTLLTPKCKKDKGVWDAMENMKCWLKLHETRGHIMRMAKGSTVIYAIKYDSLVKEWQALQVRLQVAALFAGDSYAIWDYTTEEEESCRLSAT